MKIVVTGTRGIPGIEGGVETHCEELYPLVQDERHEVVVVRRSAYVSPPRTDCYKGVKVKDIAVFRSKHLEAFVHTFLSVIYARLVNADVVHIHAIGPALFAPLARLLGMKVVVTHHGADYEREKWGNGAKHVLRWGETCALRWSNRLIVISETIQKQVAHRLKNKSKLVLIPNGVTSLQDNGDRSYLSRQGLDGKRYLLAVGRLVSEKKFATLIDAFKMLNEPDLHLVIAGSPAGNRVYEAQLEMLIDGDERIHMLGFVEKKELVQLYKETTLFVIPSAHEGLPIVLLEALSCGCKVLTSDIPAHLEVNLPAECYFTCSNSDALKEAIERQLQTESNEKLHYDLSKYDWKHIAESTRKVYDSLFLRQ
ncbi:MAG: glycosyltransferase family 4 protein [Bacteroides sp.]|nr:glycosyltransferase family 4 protein [Bacteroides sp.]